MVKELHEDLNIYKKYVELIHYTYMISEKFPKKQVNGIMNDIKHTTNNGLRHLMYAIRETDNYKKVNHLNQLEIELKILKTYIRVSHKFKYINSRNYTAWSYKITNVTNLCFGFKKSYLKKQKINL